jgi:arabinogalactan endo-1,4-beta-galactosidase
LWNEGRVCDGYNTTQQWDQLAQLLKEGMRGVKESLDPEDSVKIMIHNWDAGDNGGNRWFLDKIVAHGVQFDIIGQSYYPWWHGNMSVVQANLNDLAQRYDKEVMIVETAYPWTLDWYDNTNNIVGLESQLHAGYPASVQGQKNFLMDLMQIILDVPADKGTGIFYWAPEHISIPMLGSPWENLTLFSFQGEVLNSITAFDSVASTINRKGNIPTGFALIQNYPNPFNSRTVISWQLAVGSRVELSVYNVLGERVALLVSGQKPAGSYKVQWDGSGLASGVYLYRLQAGSFAATKKLVLLR